MIRPAHDWLGSLEQAPPNPALSLEEGRGGKPTLKVGDVYLHSRYRPREEAKRLVDSAALDPKRPVLVVGLGLGYHVLELLDQEMEVLVLEPDPAVAKLALEGPVKDSAFLLGAGDIDELSASEAFGEFAARMPQILVHPPTAGLYPEYAEAASVALSHAALSKQRLRVAVVGPLYGGSLPIARYLERAFRSLGHAALLVDNSMAWPVYDGVLKGIKNKQAQAQLENMCANFLGEWSYARVVEFAPDICIVIAQAPVNPKFPLRLAKDGIVTAFWYVENWRHLPYWQQIARFYDYFFHIQPGEFEDKLRATGCESQAVVFTGCDPEIHKPVELTPGESRELACDMSFAGAGYYNRVEMFKGLTDYDFKIWGVEWTARELRNLVCRAEERFTPELFAKIVSASKISLNLHSSTACDGVDPKCDAINPRVFEIAACGGFQLCDPCKGLEKLFDYETELPVYRNLAELRGQIDHYLEHPEERREVAERAQRRALRDHTYAKRAQQMLDLILERYGNRILRKGVRVQRSMSEMAERVGRDTELGAYLAKLPPDMLFTHENMNEVLDYVGIPTTYPEQVFSFLREMRSFAETLLELKGV